jgi:hypothetical protein
MALTLSKAAVSTLEEGRQLHVAVPSIAGPHVTPELFTFSGGRLWFASASSTVKTKVLHRERSAGAVVSVAGRSIVLSGTVDAFDPRDPAGFVRRYSQLPAAASALARFTMRNASDLLAFAGDTLTGKLGIRVPPVRLLFALDPTAAAYVENDALVDCWGTWTCRDSGEDEAIPAGGEHAVVAFPGPVPLPARWYADQQVLYVVPVLLRLLSFDGEFPIGIVVDEYTAPGPAAKRGSLLRGRARVVTDDPGFVEVELERAVEWDGVDTASADLG